MQNSFSLDSFTSAWFKLDSEKREAPVLLWFNWSFGLNSQGWASSTYDLVLRGARFHPGSRQHSKEDCQWRQCYSVFFYRTCSHRSRWNNMGAKGYSGKNSFASGTSLKWKSLEWHSPKYSVHIILLKDEKQRKNSRGPMVLRNGWFYKATGTLYPKPITFWWAFHLKGEVQTWDFDSWPFWSGIFCRPGILWHAGQEVWLS